MAEKVRDKLCEAAASRIESNSLSVASEFLSCVPEPAVNDRVLELREALKDRSGLLDYLSKATVISGNHVVAAKRLADLTGSKEAIELHKKAQAAWDHAKTPAAGAVARSLEIQPGRLPRQLYASIRESTSLTIKRAVLPKNQPCGLSPADLHCKAWGCLDAASTLSTREVD